MSEHMTVGKFLECVWDTWKELGNRFTYTMLYTLFDEIKNSEDPKVLAELRRIEDLVSENLASGLQDVLCVKIIESPDDKFEYSTPDASSLTVNYSRWRNGDVVIYETTMISLGCIGVAMLAFSLPILFNSLRADTQYRKLYKELGVGRNKCSLNDLLDKLQKRYDFDKIIRALETELPIDDQPDFEKRIKESEDYAVPFLLASVLLIRQRDSKDGKFEEEKVLEVKQWLIERFQKIQETTEQFDNSAKPYFESLWNDVYHVDVSYGIEKDSLEKREKARISNLYVLPTFMSGTKEIKPFSGEGKTDRHMILASSGSGKTTFLQAVVASVVYERLCRWDSDTVQDDKSLIKKAYDGIKLGTGIKRDYFPIYIKATDINEKTLEELNDNEIEVLAIEKYSQKELTDLVKLQPEGDDLLLLIDAFDEVDGSQRRMILGKKIDSFFERYSSASMIFTSRHVSFEEYKDRTFFKNIDWLVLNPFKNKEIKDMISRWLQWDEDRVVNITERIEKKYHLICSNRYYSQFAANPYMLCYMLKYQKIHPESYPQDIVSDMIDLLIEKRWNSEKYIDCRITKTNMRKMLSFIAWKMASDDNHVLSPYMLSDAFSDAAKAAEIDIKNGDFDSILQEINIRAGLLILTADGYRFQRAFIENYLASEWIITQLRRQYRTQTTDRYQIIKDIESFMPDVKQSYWSEILLMMFSPAYRLGNRDQITPAVFAYLLYHSSETLAAEELVVISRVFFDLLMQTFGRNKIANSGGSEDRICCVRFLENQECIKSTDISNGNISDTWSRIQSTYKDDIAQLEDIKKKEKELWEKYSNSLETR